MREEVDQKRIEAFLHAFASHADQQVRVYLTGGATAVLFGWRGSTIDIDLRLIPDNDRMLQSLPRLKEELRINVELASPADFIPEIPGWETRSQFILQDGKVAYYHYDIYAQALSKIERFHEKDVLDVKEMIRRQLVKPNRLQELFEAIVHLLYRFPAISPEAFRKNLNVILLETKDQ